MAAHWRRYIEEYGYMLVEGDEVEAINDFWFYSDFYEKGQRFTISADMVGHAFENWVKKVGSENE